MTLPCATEADVGTERERETEAKRRSLPKCSFLAGLFGHSAPELTSWAQSFLTQWCQTRDCDVQLTQVNSVAPAGNMHTQTQTDCYQVCAAISMFGIAADPNDSFVLHWFIKEAFRHMAYGDYAETLWKLQSRYPFKYVAYFTCFLCLNIDAYVNLLVYCNTFNQATWCDPFLCEKWVKCKMAPDFGIPLCPARQPVSLLFWFYLCRCFRASRYSVQDPLLQYEQP